MKMLVGPPLFDPLMKGVKKAVGAKPGSTTATLIDPLGELLGGKKKKSGSGGDEPIGSPTGSAADKRLMDLS